MEFSAKTLWPLFPLLLLIAMVCLTWALVVAVRRSTVPGLTWIQGGALACYLAAAITAIASESGALSANIHRPFSLLTQVLLVVAIYRLWGQHARGLVGMNLIALGAIIMDTLLHYVLVRS